MIERIRIPKGLVELKDGWFVCALKLTKVEVDFFMRTKNILKCITTNFLFKDQRNKTNIPPILFFCRRNIKTMTIPNFIEVIKRYLFLKCDQLGTVEFPPDSKLKVIESYSFSESSIKSFAFRFCKQIETFSFAENSKLSSLNKKILYKSSIKNIVIPSNTLERAFFRAN